MRLLARAACWAALSTVALPVSAAAIESVDAGTLRAEVQADPWRVVLRDSAGRMVRDRGCPTLKERRFENLVRSCGFARSAERYPPG